MYIGGCLLDENANAYKKVNLDPPLRRIPSLGMYIMEGDGQMSIFKILTNNSSMCMYLNMY